MNYLGICQRVNEIVGFQGTFNSVEATGYQSVISTAVRDAYEDIQRYRVDWNYLKADRPINISDAKTEYTLSELWAGSEVDLDEYRYLVYDYRRLEFIPYDDFVLVDYSNWTSQKPLQYTVDPASYNLLISPVDQVYTVDLYYVKTLHMLVGNTDEPVIPPKYHQAIVYGAIMKLSTFIGNVTLYDMYSVKYAEIMGQLMRAHNPAKKVAKRPIV